MAKIAGWHGLILPHEHDPQALTADTTEELITASLLWFDRVIVYERQSLASPDKERPPWASHPLLGQSFSQRLSKASAAQPTVWCPHIFWDAMPRAGASQVHTHCQVVATPMRYLSAAHKLRSAAFAYTQATSGRNYFSDLISALDSIGLAVPFGEAVICANLTPPVGVELWIMSSSPSRDFCMAFHAAIDALRSTCHMHAFTASINLPPMSSDDETSAPIDSVGMPTVGRIVDRGAFGDSRSDMSANEIYGSPVTAVDPFELVRQIRPIVEQFRSISSKSSASDAAA